MSITVKVSRYFLGGWTGESVSAEVGGNTVGQCLDGLLKQFPAIRPRIFENSGALAVEARVFVNGESAFPDELATAVRDGDVIDIVPMTISGG